MEWNIEDTEKVSEKLRSFSEDIDKISLNYQNKLKRLNDEFQVCIALSKKVTILSDRVDEFHSTRNEKSAQTLDPDSEQAVALIALYQKAEEIQKTIKRYKDTNRGVFSQLKHLITHLKQKTRSLKWAEVQCFLWASFDEPEDSDPLDFQSYHGLYSRATDLNRKWDEEDLTPKVDGCLERLREF